MPFTSSLARRFELPISSQGQLLAVLALLSILVSSVSVGLNGIRLGFTSLFFIPGAFVVTIIHHLSIWYNLRIHNRTSPAQIHTPPFLKHAGNILVLLMVSLLWMAGGILTIIFILIGAPYGAQTMSSVPDWISSGLAFAEAMVLLFMMAICWRALAREGYRPSW
ncbi:hypothetical protein B0J17DRAFT_668750 [Rhizoctonia solani]|nr:hypothetical protein B0J17DRAFT_668750 [Rhizoctonia solani]